MHSLRHSRIRLRGTVTPRVTNEERFLLVNQNKNVQSYPSSNLHLFPPTSLLSKIQKVLHECCCCCFRTNCW